MQSVNAPSGDDETGAGQFAVSAAGTLLYVTGGINPMMQRSLVWVDRAGTAKSMAAPAGLYTGQRISPDGERIAMFANRGATRTNDLWIYDLVRGAPTRLTVDANNTWPVWSPDGKRLVYASNISGVSNLYAINADGSGRPERLTTSDCMQLPSSWASVANAVAFLQRRQLDGNFEIWVLPMTGDKKARLFLESRFNLMWPDLSPDGQWMAYVSNESGDNEVYVQPYPGPGEKIRLSTSGGTQPIWTTNGLELLYRSGTLENQQVFSMKIRSLSPFRADAPRLLFEAKARDYGNTSPIRGWDMTPDGQRFLFVRSNAPGNKPLSTVQVVLNWFEELKQRVPSAR
jgi:dipeptidyl aminopeptidase/acylaminoacyl peptidase